MKPVNDKFCIVITGYWNIMIFQPGWIHQHLTSSDDIKLEFPINNPFLPPRFHFDGLYVNISKSRIMLSSESIEDGALINLQDLSKKLLTLLPHTPISGLGINFSFIENNPADASEMIKIFDTSDTSQISVADVSVKSTLVRRMLLINHQILNLELQMTEHDDITVDFNFHFEAQSAEKCIECLNNGSIIEYKQKAYDILRDWYKIEVSD